MKLWSENAKENKLGGRSEVPIGLDNNIEFLIHFYEYQADVAPSVAALPAKNWPWRP